MGAASARTDGVVMVVPSALKVGQAASVMFAHRDTMGPGVCHATAIRTGARAVTMASLEAVTVLAGAALPGTRVQPVWKATLAFHVCRASAPAGNCATVVEMQLVVAGARMAAMVQNVCWRCSTSFASHSHPCIMRTAL